MIDYKTIRYSLIKEIAKEFIEHYYEKEQLEDNKINIDWGYFDLIEDHFLTLALDSKGIVGIIGFQVHQDVNDKDLIEASNTVIFVREKHRGRVSKEILDKAIAHAKSKGANKISFLINSDTLGGFLKNNGFKHTATEWSIMK